MGLRKGDKIREKENPDSFRSSFRIVLILGQILGLMPLGGISGVNLFFTWTNPIHLYGFFIFGITVFFHVFYTMDNFNTKFAIDNFASIAFYSVCLLSTFFFLRIAIQFPRICDEFEEVERNMADYGSPRKLGLKIKVFICVFVILAAFEHGTMICINIADAWILSSETGKDFGPLLYAIRFPPINQRISYSAAIFFLLFWVNVICTFNWNYSDFFLISLSLEISTRFALINSKLTSTPDENKNGKFFVKIIEDYNRLSLLAKKMDRRLGNIILTSFFSNTYHISLQLVRSLKLGGTLLQRIYFYFSFTYLITRFLTVLVFASKIHDESKKPASMLFSLDKISNEAVRFLHQVLTDEIAFTGNKFFVITRKFVMSVIGTIITYQAFLLQFNSLNQERSN